MKDFEFFLPTHIIFGKNAERQSGRLAVACGKRILLLYGSARVIRNGLLPAIQKDIEENGGICESYGGITENPVLSTAEKICAFVKEKKIDLLLAVGGGSVIDTAKAVSIGSCYNGKLWDFYSGKAVPQKALPIGVVLTMAATASEANCVSVLTNEELGKKTAFYHPLTFPKFALLNPELTYTVSGRQSAIGAIDIFAHAFERYFHLEQKGVLRQGLCTAVMKTVLAELPIVQQEPENYDARSQLMWAATMAHSDMIGAEGVFACHEMSHILTEEYDLPHGLALGILMPAWCKYMLLEHAEEIAEFSRQVWDVPQDGRNAEAVAQDGISKFQNFICLSGLPVTLREAGICNADSKKLAEKMLPEPDAVVGENFQPLHAFDVQAIFELAKG